ncbi:MAG: hypothetical protein ACREQK_08280, partial [Candidatus Binatia bacterium]
MRNPKRTCRGLCLGVTFALIVVGWLEASAQEKVRVAYSSTDTLNGLWTIADGAGFYKKHGLDAEVIYIGSSTVAAAAVVSN